MIYEIENKDKAAAVFGDWEETMIWSCLQNVMGHIYGNDKNNPVSVMAILGDFCFFAGDADMELTAFKPDWCSQDFIIAIPQNERWAKAIEEHYKDRAKKVVRYATKKEKDIFDRRNLEKIVKALSQEYTIEAIDKSIFNDCKKEEWSKDLVSQFQTFEDYEKLGMGFAIMRDGEIVSGVSSYSSYNGGIEIEIDTKKEYRRRGLALVCGAKIILECLYRGIYPSWDAQNLGSLSLAKKLGYHFSHEYDAYEISGYCMS